MSKDGEPTEGILFHLAEHRKSCEVCRKDYEKNQEEFDKKHGFNCKECNERVYKCLGDGFCSKPCQDSWNSKNNPDFTDNQPNSPAPNHQPINNPQSNQPNQTFLSTLQNIQAYLIVNNIHSITNQDGNLLITFNTNTNTTPPSQTITEQQISGVNSTIDQEQRTMWQKFKDYLKKTGKNKIDKQELEQEIKKLSATSETKKPETKIWPWIAGGVVMVAVLGIVIALIRNRKKNKKL